MTTVERRFSNQHEFTTDVDISTPDFWSKSFVERDESFARLRADAPVSWHPPLVDPWLPPEVHGEAGFWAVVRHKDIRMESLNNKLFSSATENGVKAIVLKPIPPQAPEGANPQRRRGSGAFLEMDPPDHTLFRRAIANQFTPKGVARIVGKIEERAEAIIDRVAGGGEFEFVSEVSSKLPMLTVADLVGVPDSLTESFARAGDNIVNAADPDITGGEDPMTFVGRQMAILTEIGVDLVKHRRAHPAEDIATALAQYEIDGQPLTDEHIASTMSLLSVAGNDTTKQTTSLTVIAFDRNPDQRAWLLDDFDGRVAGSVEEFIRHASPVMDFSRVATADTNLGGQQISRGDKVVMFYCSGNRDETVFPDAHRFDLSRNGPAHVGFGGGGIHFCLGNGVAKAQLRALFKQILTRLPTLEVVGEPQQLRHELINGVSKLWVRA